MGLGSDATKQVVLGSIKLAYLFTRSYKHSFFKPKVESVQSYSSVAKNLAPPGIRPKWLPNSKPQRGFFCLHHPRGRNDAADQDPDNAAITLVRS